MVLCIDGLADGEGTLVFLWSNKREVIKGVYSKGRIADGRFEIVYSDGSSNSGFLKGGDWEGRLIHKNPDGSLRFNGQVKSGKKEGFGVYWLTPTFRYEGYFANDMANGRGFIFSKTEEKEDTYEVFAKNNCIWRYYGQWVSNGAIGRTQGECLAEGYP